MQDLLPWMAPWGVWALYVLMLVGGGALVWQGWFARRAHDQPRCPTCGYERTGLPHATCPECGYVITRPWEPYLSRRRRHSVILLGLMVAGALPSVAVTRRVREFGWEYYCMVGPVYWMFPDRTLWSQRFGDYEMSCVQDAGRRLQRGYPGQKLIIRRSGSIVVEQSDDAVSLNRSLVGTDLNGNGVPDVVAHFDSAGSSGSRTYRVYELGEEGVVTLAEFHGRSEAELARYVDADGDGIFEIICAEWIYDGNESHAVPSVLLWDGRQFVRHTPPPAAPQRDVR